MSAMVGKIFEKWLQDFKALGTPSCVAVWGRLHSMALIHASLLVMKQYFSGNKRFLIINEQHYNTKNTK